MTGGIDEQIWRKYHTRGAYEESARTRSAYSSSRSPMSGSRSPSGTSRERIHVAMFKASGSFTWPAGGDHQRSLATCSASELTFLAQAVAGVTRRKKYPRPRMEVSRGAALMPALIFLMRSCVLCSVRLPSVVTRKYLFALPASLCGWLTRRRFDETLRLQARECCVDRANRKITACRLVRYPCGQ